MKAYYVFFHHFLNLVFFCVLGHSHVCIYVHTWFHICMYGFKDILGGGGGVYSLWQYQWPHQSDYRILTSEIIFSKGDFSDLGTEFTKLRGSISDKSWNFKNLAYSVRVTLKLTSHFSLTINL